MNQVATRKKRRASGGWGLFGVHAVLIFGSALMIIPFLWMILTSFKTISEATRFPPTILPMEWMAGNFSNIWKHYEEVMNRLPFGAMYYNTIMLMLIRVLCAVVFSSMAGYAFAKLRFPLKGPLFYLVLIQLMLPSQIFLIPQFIMVSNMQRLNTMFALVFPGLVSAFGTFFLRQFYLSLPSDLSEAAKLDGCNAGQTFLLILFPLTLTAVMALGVFTALFAFNNMMWPLIVNPKPDKRTLAAGIDSLRGQFTTEWPILMAGATLASVPMIVVYLFFQRQFIEGIALTGQKA